MSFNIKDIVIKNRVVLAPMAGISNPSYMKICEEMGVGYVVTELISAEAIVRDNKKTFDMLKGIDELNINYAIQLFGSDVGTMVRAAKIINKKYPKAIIDINMGCPVPKVAIKNEAGSALLKNPLKIKEIVSAVVNAVDVPVTVKIRSGWDEKNINAVLVAKIVEEAGASLIAVHARTRSQGYSGSADWNIIKQVKEAVKIPVIGNGDIKSCYDAKKMIDETGCDAVMLGRGVIGNPWLIRDSVNYLKNNTLPGDISVDEKIDMMKRHYKLLVEEKGEISASLEIRMFILYYLKGLPYSKEIKNMICQTKDSNLIFKILDDYRLRLKEEGIN